MVRRTLGAGLLIAAAAAAFAAFAAPALAAPMLTINTPAEGSVLKERHPTIAGVTSDESDPVTVSVYHDGSRVFSESDGPGGGNWSVEVTSSLSDGSYTAIATQKEGLTSESSEATASFSVHASAPSVTLDSVSSPTNDTTPSFSGTATEGTTVTVLIHRGSSSGGEVVASATAPGTGGSWSSGAASPGLADGTYTAVAEQESEFGNGTGFSQTRTFTVHASTPSVTLDPVDSPTNDSTPSFSGTASEHTHVTVVIHRGGSAAGSVAAEAGASGTGGSWSSGGASPALPDGTYTAVAEQESEYGDGPGYSVERTFTVFTARPHVTLAPVNTPSNDTTPVFTGTASETTPVTVHIAREGSSYTEAHADGTGGGWTSGQPDRALSEGSYTAVAEQENENGSGKSETIHFTVITTSPKVTLNSVKSPSKDTTPSFSGSATGTEPVEVLIYRNAVSAGNFVTSVSAEGTGSGWGSGPSSPLESGTYVAVAEQRSPVGNTPGRSGTITFVVDTSSPVVTLNSVPARSNNTNPTFTGTATDSTSVTVRVSRGSEQVATASASPSNGTWKSGGLSKALTSGSYTAVAEQASSLENPTGKSAPINFVVETSPPGVTLDAVAEWSSGLTPSFSGATTEAGTITVSVYRGTGTGGPKVSGATAQAAETEPGHWTWSSAAISPALATEVGTYTVVATQNSAIGNGPGRSKERVFKIDPGLPHLEMNTPPSQTNHTAPVFSGTSNQTQAVTVKIFAVPAGSKECVTTGPALAQASASPGKVWATGAASPALHEGQYAAIAFEPRAAGGETEASTAPACFSVDLTPPVVSITSPTAGASLSGGVVNVSGRAGTTPHDEPRVTVQLFAGSTVTPGATPLQQVVVASAGPAWTAAFGGLSTGSYVLRAEQSDAAGNVGATGGVPFTETAGTPPPAPPGPSASFSWYPAKPHTGETVTLISNSADAGSPITGYAWALAGAFLPGGQSLTTRFASPGSHLVQLRVNDANGRSGLASEAIPVTYPLMRPFPVVRIVTTRSVGRVRLKLLSVQAPRGTRVQVACIGKGCPLRSQVRAVASTLKTASVSLAFPRFERSLPAGVSLQVRIYAASVLGKFTSFKIRRGKLPLRSDACLRALEQKPVTCPG